MAELLTQLNFFVVLAFYPCNSEGLCMIFPSSFLSNVTELHRYYLLTFSNDGIVFPFSFYANKLEEPKWLCMDLQNRFYLDDVDLEPLQ